MYYFFIALSLILLYIYGNKNTERFREKLKIGNKASFYYKKTKIKGIVTKIHKNSTGKITFVEIDNMLINIKNVYR